MNIFENFQIKNLIRVTRSTPRKFPQVRLGSELNTFQNLHEQKSKSVAGKWLSSLFVKKYKKCHLHVIHI